MLRASFIPVLVFTMAGGALAGCANEIPARPPPPPEAQPELPPWYPEKPWTEKGADDRVYYFGKIVFDTDEATLRPESEAVLQQLLEYLKQNPDISRVRLEGHTDERADEEYNQGLSERRAVAVADWLVDHGLDHNRILAVAFGETRPMVPNDTAAGRQENRRTEFHVAEVAGNRFRGQEPTAGGLVLTVLSKEEREALEKQGEVPTYVPPKVVPEKNVFKPYPPVEAPKADEESATPDAPTDT